MVRPSRREPSYVGFLVFQAGFLFSVISSAVFHLLYRAQPTPFLNEVFHIRQAQLYCSGNFSVWDSKITTLPGLYLISTGILQPVTFIFNRGDACTVYGLRFLNLVASVFNFYLIYRIQRCLRSSRRFNIDEFRKDLFSAFTLAMFPILYFFSFFYYTDTISTTLVLLCYLLYLHNTPFFTTFTAVVSVLVRQTNIIWLGFICQLAVDRVLQDHVMQRWEGIDRNFFQTPQYINVLHRTLRRTWLYDAPAGRRELVKNLFGRTCGFIAVGLGFIGFVYFNEGIVVGDRTAHQFCVHFPQVFYYSLFVLVFAFPYAIEFLPAYVKIVCRYRKTAVLLMLLMAYIIQFNTLVHPYLLADNRHYTFYIWKRIYEAHFMVKYALIPVYLFGIFCIFKILDDSDLFFQTGYIFFTLLCLVPQKLVEFRYFIVPFIFLRMQYFRRSWTQLYCEFYIFCVINTVTIYIFLTRPFYWPDSDEVQHFLW